MTAALTPKERQLVRALSHTDIGAIAKRLLDVVERRDRPKTEQRAGEVQQTLELDNRATTHIMSSEPVKDPDAVCSTDGCANPVPWAFQGLLDDPARKIVVHERASDRDGEAGPGRVLEYTARDALICLTCSDVRRDQEDERRESVDPALHRRRIKRAGLVDQEPARKVLGIELGKRPVRPRKWPTEFDGAARSVVDFLGSRKPRTLILSGPPQCGKTTYAVWAAYETRGRFISAAELLEACQSRGQGKFLREAKYAAGVMVLDDAFAVRDGGKPAMGPIVAELVRTIAIWRHDSGRATVLTTNASAKEIVDAYLDVGEPVVDRARGGMSDYGVVEGGFVECKGADKKASQEELRGF